MRRIGSVLVGLITGWTLSAGVLLAVGQTPPIPQPLLHVVGMDTLSLASSYVELIVQDDKRRQFGFCTSEGSFIESVTVQLGTAMILERGVVQKTATAPAGSVFRLALTDGMTGVSKNGTAIWISATPLLEAPHVEVAVEDGVTVLGRLTTWSQ